MAGPRVILNMSKLLELEREAPGRAEKVVQKIAQDCEAYAKDNMNDQSPAPAGQFPGVDTGNLKASIVAEPGANALEWRVAIGAEYAPHLEYGTEKMAARPFLLPSVEAVADMIPPDLLQEVVK